MYRGKWSNCVFPNSVNVRRTLIVVVLPSVVVSEDNAVILVAPLEFEFLVIMEERQEEPFEIEIVLV